MNRMGGWLAKAGVPTPDGLLAVLGKEVSGNRSFPLRTWHTDNAGVVVGGSSTGCAMVSSGPYSLAIVGQVRWDESGARAGEIEQVAQCFLEAYRARKSAALAALRGSFALVVVDTESNEALLAIDRFGIQNLVYQAGERELIFGSTCDVICKHPRGSNEVDPQAIYDYTYFHVVPGPKTIYRGQARLLPGHYLTWSGGKVSIQAYWSMSFAEKPGSVADFKPRFREVLREAVASTATGGRCGAFLSGGTDSSTVAGTLGEVTKSSANTYSIGFAVEGYDEIEYARIASRHFGTTQHEYYVTPEDVLNALPLIAGVYDQPFGNASAVAAYYCAKLAKADGIARLLAGDGGDEIFGGNARYAKQYQLAFYEKLPGFVRKGMESFLLPLEVLEHVPLLSKVRSYVEQAYRPMPARYDSYNLINRLGPKNLFTPAFLSRIDLGSPTCLMDEAHKNYRQASLINQMLGIDLKFTLADSDLPKVVRMCELAGVEVAFPLLDEAVVDFSGQLPADLKLRGTKLRYFFKEALRDFLPSEILTKSKHGFGLPIGAWLTTHPGLKSLAGDSLTSLKARGIVAPDFIDRLLGEHMREHAAYYGAMAWILMMLELWFQKHPSARFSPSSD